MDVHRVAVDVLKSAGQETRLVSLVGCPGTGKTLCGWLVCYSLHNEGKKTLHLTIRGNLVIVVLAFKTKKIYRPVEWNVFMLEEILTETTCDVCIMDVGEKTPVETNAIFRGVRTILENPEEPKPFLQVKFMGLVSGHGEENIVGKEMHISKITQRLVLWSWTEEEFNALLKKMKESEKELPKEDAYSICGGSVRGLFSVDDVKKSIREAVLKMSQDEIGKLHNFDIPQGDQGHKQRNTLLAFRPRGTECFTEGISGADFIHRSEYVMHCIKHFQKANFQQVKQMYEMLLPRNTGAAGTAFEMLVQLFWSDVIQKKCEVELTLDWRDEGATPKQTIKINGNAIQYQPNKIEVYDQQDADDDAVQMLKGYFTPNTFHYPVLDSILRYEQEGQIKVLAIQVSIGQTHEHSEPRKNALLEKKVEGMPKPKLALWDFPVKGPKVRKCQWKNSPSEHWDLTYVQCEKFEKWFEFGHLRD